MAHIINCGEQEIEGNGISISLSVIGGANTISAEDLYISIIDNLLGVSEFIAECKYDFADVSIGFELEGNSSRSYKRFKRFLCEEENQKLADLFNKYCSYTYEEPTEDEGVIWYSFVLDNVEAEMSEEDHIDFCEIFKERLK